MITISKNQTYFGVITLILTAIFSNYLYSDLSNGIFDHIWVYALSFGAALFAFGFAFGYKDPVRESRNDLPFQYHLTTFIIVNTIGITWLLFVMGINQNTLINGAFQCVPWAIGLAVHYYFSSKSVKGMPKGEIFD